MPDSPLDLADLPAIEGDVLDDEPALAAAARDWGHIVQARPRAVVRAASAADVAAVVEFAAARGVPVAPRGAGHSPFGQCQADGGIVLDLTGLARVHGGEGDTLVVDAGARWQRVLGATLPRGLTPPVLTDYLELTVGGTLSVGGLGGASHHHGAQTDTITELEVVTGTGELVRCSAEHHSDLFDAVRAGLGQCGIITRATVRLRPARQRARRRQLYYDSLGTFLADARTVVKDGRFDYVEGQLILDDDSGTWRHMLEATSYFSLPHDLDEAALLGDLADDRDAAESEEMTYHGFLDRMADGETVLREEGSWFHPHPWLNVFLPDDEVADVVTETLAATEGADLGDSGLVMLYPIRADRLSTPLLRVPSSELVWLFALLRTGRPYDPEGVARMIRLNAELAERVRPLGGTVYPVNSMPMTPHDWKDHFGGAWDALETAKRTYDPHGVLTPGQGVFAPG
ncbi:FAD-binding protein [Prauserella muralis]|uniref:Dehydrogenase n=1 Tax=Prauserella muralis TaxID=588067 RepID=A0A2V4AYG8_9PSEU|nr:FAD-binding protein [Prauserella muralis]PXY26956.1 dehydrogenase [Prauserella muralis]TWE23430.1 FAD/FMN-containing dehydrogenase [Prauserella muralis]